MVKRCGWGTYFIVTQATIQCSTFRFLVNYVHFLGIWIFYIFILKTHNGIEQYKSTRIGMHLQIEF